MRIHFNLTSSEAYYTLCKASQAAVVSFERCREHGSRTHTVACDVILSGESGRHMNSGSYGARTDSESASWDQWGIFLAVLFDADATALCGSAKYPVYADAEDFHYKTCGRFRRDLLESQSPVDLVTSRASADYKITSHRWQYDHEHSHPLSGYSVFYCKGHGTPKNKRRECSALLARG